MVALKKRFEAETADLRRTNEALKLDLAAQSKLSRTAVDEAEAAKRRAAKDIESKEAEMSALKDEVQAAEKNRAHMESSFGEKEAR